MRAITVSRARIGKVRECFWRPLMQIDVADIRSMSAYELCEKAEELGIDLRRFEVQ